MNKELEDISHFQPPKRFPMETLFKMYALELAEQIDRRETFMWSEEWPFPILHAKYFHQGMYERYYHRFPHGEENGSLVLDVGSGHQPSPVSNVLGERYLSDTIHRPKATEVVKRNLVTLDAVQLPFKNQQFDLCILSHVVEHLPPHALLMALSEATRVARECYVEVPHRDYEMQWGFFEHYYFIYQVGKKVIFEVKTREEWVKALPQILEYTHHRNAQIQSPLIRNFHQELVGHFDKYYLGMFLHTGTLADSVEIHQRPGAINSEEELASLKKEHIPPELFNS